MAAPSRPRAKTALPLETVLAPDAQTLNQSFVALRTAIFQVLQHPAAARDHGEQATLRVVVLLMPFQMFRERRDPLTQQRYLDLWRSGISLMNPVLRDYFRLLFNCQSHARNDTPRLYLNLDFYLSDNSTVVDGYCSV